MYMYMNMKMKMKMEKKKKMMEGASEITDQNPSNTL